MKKLTLALLTSTAIMLTNPALAQTPSNESIARLLQVTNFAKETQASFRTSMVESFTTTTIEQAKQQNPNLTADQIIKIDEIARPFASQIADELWADPAFLNIMLGDINALYQQVFNQQEADAMIAFYDSPIGQSINRKQTQVVQDFYTNILPRVDNYKAAYAKNNRKKFLQFEKQLLEILSE